jgi:hypothetical protein
MGVIGRDARRVIRHLYRELTTPEAATATPEPASLGPAAAIPEPAVSPEAEVARPASRS